MLSRLFGRSRTNVAGDTLYRAIVAQARLPLIYRVWRVPDTVDGRFEMIVLHVVLLFRRLGRDGDSGQAIAQEVFDIFLADMDQQLREMGVGDLGVPKRMKKIGQSFYGRLATYGTVLAKEDEAGLLEALERNLFPDGNAPSLAPLAAYAMAAATQLSGQPTKAIAGGTIAFPDPATMPAAA
ncbi:MAG: ubiquinol-cytochrome C chaperone [Bauldia sp.]|nr:ubiquinol-cytochrome C chaperone [Bauldia sp.]